MCVCARVCAIEHFYTPCILCPAARVFVLVCVCVCEAFRLAKVSC